MSSGGIHYVMLKAVLAALLVSSSGIVAYILSDGSSPTVFSDWDEPYYLALMRDASRLAFKDAFAISEYTFGLYSLVPEPLPHATIDFLLGKLWRMCDISLVQFALLLDLACSILSFLVARKLFRQLGIASSLAELAAFVCIATPWLAALQNYLPGVEIPGVSFRSHNLFPSPPAMRAVHTQISFLAFLWVLIPLIKFLQAEKPTLWVSLKTGAYGGILIYFYFFAWGAFMGLAGAALLAQWALRGGRLFLRTIFLNLLALSLSSLIVAGPGLLAISSREAALSDRALNLAINSDISSVWFFSPSMFLFMCLLLVLCARSQSRGDPRYHLHLLSFSCILAEFLLMNLQPLLNRWIAPYHFPLFFLHPVLSGSSAVLLVAALKSRLSRAAAALLLLAPISGYSIRAIRTAQTTMAEYETRELIDFAKKVLPPDSIVAIMPFNNPPDSANTTPEFRIMPYWLASMADIKVLAPFMSTPYDRRELIEEELLVSWILTGNLKLLGPCPTNHFRYKDMMTGAKFVHERLRTADCSIAREILKTLTPCQALQDHRVDYMIWEKQFESLFSSSAFSSKTPIWRSSKGRYAAHKFHSTDAIALTCATNQIERGNAN